MRLVVGAVLVIAGFGTSFTYAKDAIFPDKHFDFLDRYCLSCHDSGTKKGKIDLEELDFRITEPAQADVGLQGTDQ